ncbi:allatostatin A [Cataglyphis hispanica]|uniref:allatostatin A n=1 Tax=Cataglyphis hispanica TaxID=1086592 RepID=UPI00218059DA|nr:allatostatin A [Cataglyphis hispanica]
MKSKTSLIALKIIMFYLLSVVGRSTAAVEEAPSSSLHIPRLNPLSSSSEGYDKPSEKRAYAYISEYKRLPLYNFGIGKRWIDNSEDKRTRPFSFGIGKRLRDYRFGIGKRNNGYRPLSMDYFSVDNMEGYHSREDNLDDFIDDKRGGQPFSFGIGKRDWKLATGEIAVSGRRPNDVIGPKYLLSLGKELSEDENLIQ